jgi:predicted dehydrogenase
VKVLNVGLIGYGKMGKRYVREIISNKNFRIEEILNHKNLKKEPYLIKKFFNSKKIDLFIISSPVHTHFKYLNHAIKANKGIIIEKPLVKNFNQLEKLIHLNKDFKKKIIIHHNDVLNLENTKLVKNLKDNKKIQKIEMFYGKRDHINLEPKPYFDWLPHPLSFITNFLGEPKKYKIQSYKRKKNKGLIKEKLNIVFNFENFEICLNFSNNFKIPSKKIIIYKNNKKTIYDGYKKSNQRSIKLLLDKFHKKNKINDISTNIKTYKLLFEIEKKLLKIIH